jgi:hypothetical protein
MNNIFKLFIIIIAISSFSFSLDNYYIDYSLNTNTIYAFNGIDDGGGSEQNTNSSAGKLIPLENPLPGVNDIPTLVDKLLGIVLKIGVPIIALAIIYTGYLFIAAQGNPEKLKQAKDTFVYVLIGAAILLGAYAIAKAVFSTVESIRGVS